MNKSKTYICTSYLQIFVPTLFRLLNESSNSKTGIKARVGEVFRCRPISRIPGDLIKTLGSKSTLSLEEVLKERGLSLDSYC